MTPLEPNTDLALVFLDILDKNGRHDLCAIDPHLPNKHPDKLEAATFFFPHEREKAREWIAARQGKRNLYLTGNRARDEAPLNRRLSESSIGHIRAVYADIDPTKIKGGDASGQHFREERVRLLILAAQLRKDATYPPSLTVDSTGGIQPWHILGAPIPATPANIALAKGIGRTLAARFGGDSVFDVCRLMRLPGTINIPDAGKAAQGRTPALATIPPEFISDKRYTLDQLAELAPPTPDKVTIAPADRGGAGSLVDMKTIEEFDSYDDLPVALRANFEAYRDANSVLAALWDDEPTALQKDTSTSGFALAFVKMLRRHGGFTNDEIGQLLWVCPHHSQNPSEGFKRRIERCLKKSPSGASGFKDESSTVATAGAEKIEWAEPADLWSTRFEPVDLPAGVVPEVIERAARDRAKRLGVEAGACAAALVTAIGSLVPAGNQLQMRQHDTDWTVKPILWTAIIGEPGSKKTAIWEQATKAVQSIESNWAKKYAVERLDFDRLNENKKRKTKSAKVALTETETFVLPPSDLSEDWPDVACEPVRRRKVVQDATTEKLAEILSQNSDGLLFTADELSGLFGGMDAYRTKGGKDRPFWLQAKEGGVSIIDRMSRDTQRVENTAISVLGGIQPSLLKKLSDDLARDGMLQRFMPIIAKKIGNGEDLAPDKAGTDAVGQITVALVNAEQSGLFKFSADADSELQRMYAFQEAALAQPGATPTLRQWIDKTTGEFGRLSLVFHFIEWFSSAAGLAGANPPPLVSLATARRARRFLTEFVYSHALVFHQSILGRSQHEGHAAWIGGYILAQGLSVIKLRDVYKNYAPFKPSETRAALATAMQGLEEDDWLSPMFERQKNGRPTWWHVNPAVHVAFAARAVAERAARASVQASISEDAGAEGWNA